MTKKHFELVAEVLETHVTRERRNGPVNTSTDTAEQIARALAKKFATVNENFDAARFLKACGIK
jgi:hypothetical protein